MRSTPTHNTGKDTLKMSNEITVDQAIANVKENDKNAIKDAKGALAALKRTAQKQREYYLRFGKTWHALREQVTSKTGNVNNQKLGKLRKKLFSDKAGNVLIDANTASYAALMYELWENKEYPLKDYATYLRPNVNNPRPLVKDYREWVAVQEQDKKADRTKAELDKLLEAGEVKKGKNLVTITDDERAKVDKLIKTEDFEAALSLLKGQGATPPTTTKKKITTTPPTTPAPTPTPNPNTIVFDKKKSTSKEALELVGESLNVVQTRMNGGNLSTEQAQVLIERLDKFKIELNRFINSGTVSKVRVDEVKTKRNINKKREEIANKTKKSTPTKEVVNA